MFAAGSGSSERCGVFPQLRKKTDGLIKKSIFVNEDEGRQRLDLFLAKKVPFIKRETWKERIEAGFVLLNEKKCRPSHRVSSGQKIDIFHPEKEEPPVLENFSIVYSDPEILLINKPPNLPVHPAGPYRENTLLGLLRKKFGPEFRGYFAHRLDRETSGLILMALESRTAAFLQKQFLTNQVAKEYSVLVRGNFPDFLDAKGWIGLLEKGSVKKKRTFLPERYAAGLKLAQECHTEFYLEKKAKTCCLVRAKLHTGRMHQIRATLCSLGYPVIGDRIYGPDENLYLKFIRGEETAEDLQILGMDRTALHSCGLGFRHPSGEFMTFKTELPEDMRLFLEKN